MLYDMVSDGVEEVGLSQPDPSVNKEGIIIFGRGISDSQTGGMSKLVAGSYDKMVECVLWIEDRLRRMEEMLFITWRRLRDRVLSVRLFVSDSELELTGHTGQERNCLFNMDGIVFVDPLFEKSVRDL